jgi:hypothetical protein
MWKISKVQKAVDLSQVVEHLPSKHKALIQPPIPPKNKTKSTFNITVYRVLTFLRMQAIKENLIGSWEKGTICCETAESRATVSLVVMWKVKSTLNKLHNQDKKMSEQSFEDAVVFLLTASNKMRREENWETDCTQNGAGAGWFWNFSSSPDSNVKR